MGERGADDSKNLPGLQLRLLMQFQITDIQFDCYLDEEGWDESDQICTEEKLSEEYIGTFWEADDGDDLIEESPLLQVGVSSPSITVTFLTETHESF